MGNMYMDDFLRIYKHSNEIIKKVDNTSHQHTGLDRRLSVVALHEKLEEILNQHGYTIKAMSKFMDYLIYEYGKSIDSYIEIDNLTKEEFDLLVEENWGIKERAEEASLKYKIGEDR